jgi:hypothetical protein
MPMKLNWGLSRKIGEANFGSRGASLKIEVEVDAALASDTAKLRDRIRDLYGLIRESLDEELHSNGPSSPRADSTPPAHSSAPARNGAAKNGDTRPATRAQVKAIFAIAKQQKIDLHAMLRARFHVYRVDDLSVSVASRLIDELKSDLTGRQRNSA